MHAYIGGTCKALSCSPIKVGGVADHVHVLCVLSRNLTVAQLVGEIKRSSSKWVKSKGPSYMRFSWQNGYGAFSVSRGHVERVRGYIDRQEEHHRKKVFKDEFRDFLLKYEIEYDERYVWD
jgi:REP element-mobilizing transposase RayT